MLSVRRTCPTGGSRTHIKRLSFFPDAGRPATAPWTVMQPYQPPLSGQELVPISGTTQILPRFPFKCRCRCSKWPRKESWRGNDICRRRQSTSCQVSQSERFEEHAVRRERDRYERRRPQALERLGVRQSPFPLHTTDRARWRAVPLPDAKIWERARASNSL